METKVRFKLRKVKKQWVTIATTSLILGAAFFSGNQVGAQETTIPTVEAPATTEVIQEDSATSPADLPSTTQVTESPANLTVPSTENTQETLLETRGTGELQDTQNIPKAQAETTVLQTDDQEVPLEQEPTAESETNTTGGSFISDAQGNWYYSKDGQNLTGPQTIDGYTLYFDKDGKQAKNQIVTIDGQSYYYDKDNGHRVTNMGVTLEGITYIADQDGKLSLQLPEPKFVVTGGHFQSDSDNNWYYIMADGHKLTGLQNVDGVNLYFGPDGKQAKGQDVTIDGKVYRFDKNNGALLRKQWYRWSELNGYRIQPVANYYARYFGPNGAALTGWQIIDGQAYYFKANGILAANEIVTIEEKPYLFDKTRQLVREKEGTVETPGYHFPIRRNYRTNADGVVLTGDQVIDGQDYNFASDGQIYSAIITKDGKKYLYLHSQLKKNFLGYWSESNSIGTNLRLIGRFGTDENGVILDGFARAYDGQLYYFQPNLDVPEILTVTEPTWKEIDGKLYHFEKSSHNILGGYPGMVTTSALLVKDSLPYSLDENGVASPATVHNQFVRDGKWNWYYFGDNGKVLTGFQVVDGVQLYFDKDGKQAKGTIVDIDGKSYYFDKDSGALWTNRSLTFNGLNYRIDAQGIVTADQKNHFSQDQDGDWIYLDQTGHMVTGWQTIDGNRLYFQDNGKQVKGQSLLIDGKYYYFDKDTGVMFRNQYGESTRPYSYKIYFGDDGSQVFGWLTLDGKRYHFDEKDGNQTKEGLKTIDGQQYYFKYGNELLINGFHDFFYADENGHLLTGWHVIDGERYYLTTRYGDRSMGGPYYLLQDEGKTYLINKQGKLIPNTETAIRTSWGSRDYYLSDKDGLIATGVQRLNDGKLYYFQPVAVNLKDGGWKEIDGQLYHFEKAVIKGDNGYASPLTTNATLEKDGITYHIDDNGIARPEEH